MQAGHGFYPAPPSPDASYVPAGTVLVAALEQDVTRRETKVGDTFTATVATDLRAGNGLIVIPAGAVLTGMVTGVTRTASQGAIRLNFTRIGVDGTQHPITAQITATRTGALAYPGSAAEGDDAVRGAVVREGKLRDALVAGELGAGAGTIVSLGSAGDQKLPGGTQLVLQLTDRIVFR